MKKAILFQLALVLFLAMRVSADTPTMTPTDIWTDTPTPANTEIDTATPAPTFTDTPVITDTDTPAETPADTAAMTDTETPADTAVITDTQTQTETPSDTDTAVITDTDTPAETPADTVVIPDTQTPTETQVLADTATPTATQTAVPGYDCVNFTVDNSAVPAMVFMKKLTLKINVGDCASINVFVDGLPVSSYYDASAKTVKFTEAGANIQIMRSGYTGGATYAVTKATLLDDRKWAYSFTFDDARISQKTNAFPILDSYGYRAGIALNTQNMQPVADGWSMSWASADMLRAHGWSFFDHNYSHQNVTCVNISTETVPVKTAIEARWPGYLCTEFVYPYCDTSHWTCIRDSGLFLSAENANGNNYADILPPNPFILNRNILTGENAASFNNLAINAANDIRPRWLINFTHDVETASPPVDQYSTNVAAFSAHIAYVYYTYGEGGLNNMWFAPTDEVMQYILTRQNAVINFNGTSSCGALVPVTPTITPTARATLTQTPVVMNTATMTTTPVPGATAIAGGAIAYPNPSFDIIKVKFDSWIDADKAELSVYTVDLRLIMRLEQDKTPGNIYPADISQAAGGVYIIKARLLKKGAEVIRVIMPVVKLSK